MIKKGEIRVVANPEDVRSKLKKLGAKKIKVSEGMDFYFNKELFKKNFHLRVRKQKVFYPKKEEQSSLTLKIHEPNFGKMNVYDFYIVYVADNKTTRDLLVQLGYKEIFIETWNNCEEFKVNDTKVELFYLRGWNWLMEIEGVIKKSKKQTYDKLLKTLNLLGFNEKDMISIEPAQYIFNKNYIENK